ncbi:MAG: glycoside hydrolase family 15 protein [Candidatus Lokiarchaeota archaeon]
MKQKEIIYKEQAPGSPGDDPKWTSSTKDGVGTSISRGSLVWFTLSHGIINEVYYPRIDQANIRDFQFLITNDTGLFEEEKTNCSHETVTIEQGIPAYKITNRSDQEHYTIEKIILTDPRRNVLLMKVKFTPLDGNLEDYRLYSILNPHIKNFGYGNDAWSGDYKGIPMLFAQRKNTTLASTCSIPYINMSCGYFGTSDGWHDINKNHQLTKCYSHASDGNIVLTGEIDLKATGGKFNIAIAFGNNPAEAGQLARTSLLNDIDQIIEDYKSSWIRFQQRCNQMGHIGDKGVNIYRLSTTVLKTHMDKTFSDGSIASLSIPWGFSKGDDDLGGYHLVWPRDLVETAGGLLSVGADSEAQQIMIYLMSTQNKDGHWPQNMWMDGTEYWHGIQMDETAFPILLANVLKKDGLLKNIDIWPTIKKAVSFLAINGPISPEDRWEEDPGYSPFTLAVEIAALVIAAEFAREADKPQISSYLLELADYWNSNIEKWTYVKNSEISKKLNVEGYYVRIGPPDSSDATSPKNGYVPIKNRPLGESESPYEFIVSPDALALVRFGLRAANNPKILNTVKVIDSMLKTETSTGPVWHRYNKDGYGEHSNGDPFDGTGIGRGWPLLTGERAHYEIEKGDIEKAKDLLKVIEAQTSLGGLIPEQVWDAEDIPQKGLFNGHPSGSATPLVWAHSEYVKLVRSLKDNKIFDMPPQIQQRYVKEKHPSKLKIWKFNHKCHEMEIGKTLRLELKYEAIIKWSIDNWNTFHEEKAENNGLGIFYADLPTKKLNDSTKLSFTFHWVAKDKWEGTNYEVQLTSKNLTE